MEQGLHPFSKTIDSIKPGKFFLRLDEYMKTASSVDGLLKDRNPVPDHISESYDSSYEKYVKESDFLLSLLTLSLKHLIDYRFSPNGQWKNIPEIDVKTYKYVQHLKLHQMALLAGISDDIEIITNSIRQSRRFRAVVLRPAETIRNATNLMGILHERLVRRPTAVLRIDHRSDEKVQELNDAFESVNSYENGHCSPFAFEARTQPAAAAYADYYDLTLTATDDIHQRTRRISSDTEELKHGWHLFRKLITKGYSHRMEKHLDSAVSDYYHRKELFQTAVNDCRRRFIR